MKSGRTLTELATELERQAKSKKDYLADTRRLSFEVAPASRTPSAVPEVVLQGVNGGMMLRPTAHQQMANTLGIPKPYYDRMLSEAPDLLARNVNTWLAKQPATKLVRTLDGQVRAILSDRYRPLDNLDLAEVVLPKLIGLNASVLSCEVTESRLYIKAVTERIQGEVKRGDIIQAGVLIGNSEIGHGTLKLEALDYRLACLNGMVSEVAVRKAHLGRGARGLDQLEDAREFFRDETRLADDKAFFMKVQDATAAMFDQTRFNSRLLKYQETSTRAIPTTADPVEVVEITSKRFGFNDTERSSILQHLIRGGDLTQWGLANAVTRAAQDVDSYDRSTELEAVGGAVVELTKTAWDEIGKQARFVQATAINN